MVTEPTLSGLHDLERVTELTKNFGIQTCVCVNKWDLNAELTAKIEFHARQIGAKTAGRIRYDRAVTAAQIKKRTLVETTEAGAAADIKELWSAVVGNLGNGRESP